MARVEPGITDRWYDASGGRTKFYGRTGGSGAADPNRYLARWKPPHAKEQAKTFPTVADARRWLRQQKVSHDNGEWVRPERAKATLATVHEEWWPQWQRGGASGRRPPKPSSIANYERWWRLLVAPTFGQRLISSIRTAQITKWASALAADGYSGSMIRGGHTVLRLVLDHAVHEERLSRNPALGARLPAREARSPRRVLTSAQLADLAAAIVNATSRPQPQYGTLVLFLARTGLRFGEAAALRVGDLDLGRRAAGVASPVAHVRHTVVPVNGKLIEGLPKSGKARTVAVPPALIEQLAALISARKSDDPVFTSPRGERLRHEVFMRLHWNPTIKKLGLDDLVPHELRHTFATEALSRGVSLPRVANQLGHANPAITATVYAHLFEEDLTMVGQAMDQALSEGHSEPRRNGGPGLRAV